jgi:hypothetical protein
MAGETLDFNLRPKLVEAKRIETSERSIKSPFGFRESTLARSRGADARGVAGSQSAVEKLPAMAEQRTEIGEITSES